VVLIVIVVAHYARRFLLFVYNFGFFYFYFLLILNKFEIFVWMK